MSQSSGAAIRRIAEEAAARGAGVVLSIGPSWPPAQPGATGPDAARTDAQSEPQPSGADRSQQEGFGDDHDDGQSDDGGTGGCPAEDSAQEFAAPGGSGYEGSCPEDVGQADEDSQHYSASEPRSFGNPLLRDYEPREQQLEMLIPPHAFPWVAQRIVGGGDPQAALKRIAAFIDETFVSEQQASCETLQMPSADEWPASQCPVEAPLLSTDSVDEVKQELSAEQRT